MCPNPKKSSLHTTHSPLDGKGNQKIEFHFELPNIENMEEEENTVQIFLFEDLLTGIFC